MLHLYKQDKLSIQYLINMSEVSKKRLAICKSCENFNTLTKICKICKCFMPAKTKWLSEVCPDDPPRWPAEKI